MGTRGDYYIGIDSGAEYLGSVGYDAFPEDQPKSFHGKVTQEGFLAAVKSLLEGSSSGSKREIHGWPWPWKDSGTTDYAYAWHEGAVWVNSYGEGWYPLGAVIESKGYPDLKPLPTDFPNMKSLQQVTLGPRSGLLVVREPMT